jgi:uncharacterized protein
MVLSTHPTTVEITTDEHLSRAGDCIIGVSAAKGCAQLDEEVKRALRTRGTKVKLAIVSGPERFEFTAEGDPGLELSHPSDIVIRKSRFLSDRTLATGASASARDIPRGLVERLKSHDAEGALEIEVTRG